MPDTPIQAQIHAFYDAALKGFSFDDRLTFIHYLSRLQRNMAQI